MCVFLLNVRACVQPCECIARNYFFLNDSLFLLLQSVCCIFGLFLLDSSRKDEKGGRAIMKMGNKIKHKKEWNECQTPSASSTEPSEIPPTQLAMLLFDPIKSHYWLLCHARKQMPYTTRRVNNNTKNSNGSFVGGRKVYKNCAPLLVLCHVFFKMLLISSFIILFVSMVQLSQLPGGKLC